jgi:hypothetical protein
MYVSNYSLDVRKMLTYRAYRTAIEFLTNTGKMCSDIRQGMQTQNIQSLVSLLTKSPMLAIEFILLSDTLGVTMLVDSINNAKPEGATESTVLGPFFAEDRHDGRLYRFQCGNNLADLNSVTFS